MNPILSFLLNPRTLIIGAILAFGIWLAVILDQNGDMKVELEAQQDKIVQLEQNAAILKAGQELQASDIARLDSIASYKQTVVIREQTLDNDLSQIPETVDAPFSDPNNLAYADRLRDYQNGVLSELTPDSPD